MFEAAHFAEANQFAKGANPLHCWEGCDSETDLKVGGYPDAFKVDKLSALLEDEDDVHNIPTAVPSTEGYCESECDDEWENSTLHEKVVSAIRPSFEFQYKDEVSEDKVSEIYKQRYGSARPSFEQAEDGTIIVPKVDSIKKQLRQHGRGLGTKTGFGKDFPRLFSLADEFFLPEIDELPSQSALLTCQVPTSEFEVEVLPRPRFEISTTSELSSDDVFEEEEMVSSDEGL